MGQITKPGMNRLAALGCRQATHQRRGYSGGVLKKNALWKVSGENSGGFGVIVSKFLSLELSE